MPLWIAICLACINLESAIQCLHAMLSQSMPNLNSSPPKRLRKSTHSDRPHAISYHLCRLVWQDAYVSGTDTALQSPPGQSHTVHQCSRHYSTRTRGCHLCVEETISNRGQGTWDAQCSQFNGDTLATSNGFKIQLKDVGGEVDGQEAARECCRKSCKAIDYYLWLWEIIKVSRRNRGEECSVQLQSCHVVTDI